MDKLLKKFFIDLDDPRVHLNKVIHKLKDIIIMAIMAVIGGCDGWEEIEIWCLSKKKLIYSLLKTKLIPSHDTFRRIFTLLDAKKFEKHFIKFGEFLINKKSKLIKDIISLDGKSLRGSRRSQIDKSALHIVNAWSDKHNIILGQKSVDSKSNEIIAIPELLNLLDVNNSVVTIDAIGTQKNIADQIIAAGGDYMLALKANHKNAFNQVNEYFSNKVFAIGSGEKPFHDKFEGGNHGRTERRRYFIKPIEQFSNLSEWKNAKYVAAVERIRSINGTEKVSAEIHYYITSAKDSYEFLASCIRKHWNVENKLHWSLDVSFREDGNRTTHDNAALNLSILRKFALNILKNDKTNKKSITLKRKIAGLDDNYLKTLLQI